MTISKNYGTAVNKKILITGIIAILIVLLLFQIILSRGFPYRRFTSACRNNLTHIYVALMQYADQNDGYFPVTDTAKVLIDGKFISKDFLKCPYLLLKHPELDETSSYLFPCEGKNIGDGIFPLVKDKKENHEKNPINILYSDRGILDDK